MALTFDWHLPLECLLQLSEVGQHGQPVRPPAEGGQLSRAHHGAHTELLLDQVKPALDVLFCFTGVQLTNIPVWGVTRGFKMVFDMIKYNVEW